MVLKGGSRGKGGVAMGAGGRRGGVLVWLFSSVFLLTKKVLGSCFLLVNNKIR